MFAEGARFDFISSNISHYMRDGGNFGAGTYIQVRGDGSSVNEVNRTQPVNAVDFENSWASLSRYVRNILDNGGAVDYRVGRRLHLTTMQGIANQLAVDHSG